MNKNNNLKIAYGLIKSAIEEIKTDSTFLKLYLDVQSMFYLNTPRNAMLIAKQEPAATQLKSESEWKELNVSFKNDQPKKIIILDPIKGGYRKGYIAKEVIDVSNTNTKSSKKSFDKKMILQALLSNSIAKVIPVDKLDGNVICKWDTKDNAIYVVKGSDIDEIIQGLANEIAKINLFEKESEIDNIKAKCVSYMICKYHGINASINENTISLLKTDLSKLDKNDLVDNLDIIRQVAIKMNNDIGQYFNNINKKKELENER